MAGLPGFNTIRLITGSWVRAIRAPNCKMRLWQHDLKKTYDLCSREPATGKNLMRVFCARRNWYSFNVLSSERFPSHFLFRLGPKAARYLFKNRHSMQLAYIQLPSTAPTACPGLKQS